MVIHIKQKIKGMIPAAIYLLLSVIFDSMFVFSEIGWLSILILLPLSPMYFVLLAAVSYWLGTKIEKTGSYQLLSRISIALGTALLFACIFPFLLEVDSLFAWGNWQPLSGIRTLKLSNWPDNWFVMLRAAVTFIFIWTGEEIQYRKK